MKIGMLWYDDEKTRSLEEKITRAVAYYREKYGEPNTCYIHPSAMNGIESVGGVALKARRETHVDNFWIGVSDEL